MIILKILIVLFSGSVFCSYVEVSPRPIVVGLKDHEMIINFFVNWDAYPPTVTFKSKYEPYTIGYVNVSTQLCDMVFKNNRYNGEVSCVLRTQSMNGSIILKKVTKTDDNNQITVHYNTELDRTTINYIEPVQSVSLAPVNITLIEGTVVQVTCKTSESFPPATVEWWQISQESTTPVIITEGINNTELEDGASYSTMLIVGRKENNGNKIFCEASNGSERKVKSKVEQITIIYGPDNVTTLPAFSIDIHEGKDLDINCSADCNPPCNFTWINDRNVTLSTGWRLTIQNISRNEKEIYLCLADNSFTGKTVNESVHINVLHGPDNVTTLPVFSIDIQEGKDLDINCSADCNPLCNFTWINDRNVTLSTGWRLIIQNISRHEKGIYLCLADNFYTGKTVNESVHVNVLHSPVVRIVQKGQIIANESAYVQIECNVDSVPLSHIYWEKGETKDQISYTKGSASSILNFTEASCLDTANYTCSAQNEFGTDVSNPVELFINCKPRIYEEINSSFSYNLTLKSGEKLTLSVKYIAYPIPNVTWKLNSVKKSKYAETIIDSKYVMNENRIFRHVSILTVLSITPDLFGEYTVVVRNDFGEVDSRFSVLELEEETVTQYTFLELPRWSLWLFVCFGVLILFLVLWTVIFVWKKRRNTVNKQSQTMKNRLPKTNSGVSTVPKHYDGSYRDNDLYIPFELQTEKRAQPESVSKSGDGVGHLGSDFMEEDKVSKDSSVLKQKQEMDSAKATIPKHYDGSYRDNVLYIPFELPIENRLPLECASKSESDRNHENCNGNEDIIDN